ncbi:hypothetical protein [Fodinicurvata sp. EGI_FJ10296]|uniref:hypothetical protein n=1 Tax=Fodinicurvata sp. EGI_FJ10296 TaxID=3231908 RepID=UPI003454F4BB
MNRLAESLGFGALLSAISVTLAMGLYHDLSPLFLRPVLLAGAVSPLLAGTLCWLLLRKSHDLRSVLITGAVAGFLTVAIGTGLYASVALIPVTAVLVGPIVSLPTAGLALAYAHFAGRWLPRTLNSAAGASDASRLG